MRASPDVGRAGRDYRRPMSSETGPVIVAGYDGSATSRAAVDWAARTAGSAGNVFVVHAYGASSDEADAEAVVDALVMTDDPLLGTNFQTELLQAPAADAIRRVAADRRADQIVVG